MSMSVCRLGVLMATVGAPILAIPQERATSSLRVREVPLGPAGTILDVSTDRTRVARVVKRDGKATVVVDSSESSAGDGVMFATFSRDGKRFAFVRKGQGKLRLVVDGVERWDWKGAGLFGAVRGGFWFSDNGKRWFLLTGRVGFALSTFKRPDSYVLVVDGTPVADDVDSWFIASEDGRRFGYLSKRADASGKETATLVLHGPDGEQSQHPGVSPQCHGCEFSPDSQRLIYSIRRNDKWVLVANGVESSECEELRWPVFSPDSSKLAVPVKRSGKWLALVDGREGTAYDEIGEGRDALGRTRSLFFSPDSKRLAFMARRREAWVPVIDGVEGEEYEELGQAIFSGDSKHVAYRAKRSGRWFVVADGAAGKPYERVENVLFSSNGGRLVYTGRSAGKSFVVVDGREGVPYEEVARPALAPGGDHVAYASKRAGKWLLVVDEIEGKEYEFLTDRTVVFDGPRELHTLIRRGAEYARLEVEIQP